MIRLPQQILYIQSILLLIKLFSMFQQHKSKTPIFAYSSLQHIFTMAFIGYLYSRYIPTRRYIWRIIRSAVTVVARSSFARPRHDQGVAIRLKIRPPYPYLEAALLLSLLSSFTLLSLLSSQSSWFLLLPYVLSQQRPIMYRKIPAVSMK